MPVGEITRIAGMAGLKQPSGAEEAPRARFDALIVGAGFSGLYMLYRLRKLGLSVRALEMGTAVGGTWYWNRYPGARCDGESLTYSYSFSETLQQEWSWSDRYSLQPEILTYLNHVANRFDLRRDIQFETQVTRADYDDTAGEWAVETDRGERFAATFCIMATGCLSVPRRPPFEGLDSYEGEWYHTGQWPHRDVEFSGKRVGVVGTGSTAIQVIPMVARQAEHLTVFQRTANFSMPAWNGPLDPEEDRTMKAVYSEYREKARWSQVGVLYESIQKPAAEVEPEQQKRELERQWRAGGFAMLGTFTDVLVEPAANELAAEFCRAKIRKRVKDPAVAELLCPKDHPFGTKRLCVDTDYYETFNRDNVTLVDIKHAPIERITPKGLRISGIEHEFDIIVFATGFDAMTGALLGIDIRGRDGLRLADEWAAGPRTYLGLTMAGFPNLFAITGPGSPSVLTNMLVSIEQHVEWVAECISHLKERGLERVEASRDAQDDWVDHVNETAHQTLYPLANSWYMGANIPGKPRVFTPYVGSVGDYRKICNSVAADGYRGFRLA